MQLSPQEAAKVARLWAWQKGQKPEGCPYRVWQIDPDGAVVIIDHPDAGDDDDATWYDPGTLRPDLTDPATADGLPRTVRAAWGGEAAEALYGALYAENDRHGWHIRRSNFNISDYFATETEAWIAALLAAPEPT